MLPLRFTQAQVQTTQKGYKTGRMVYNELEQGGILSDLRFGLALLAYTDILLCSIWSFYKIRQTPVRCTILRSCSEGQKAVKGHRWQKLLSGTCSALGGAAWTISG